MSINAEIQSLEPSALLEFFQLDTTHLPGGSIELFHAGTNGLKGVVYWQGNPYYPMPIEAEGFQMTTKGTLPRPKIRIANINGLLSSAVMEFDDLVGCKIIRKRTYARFLDAQNFPGNVNPEADPTQFLDDDEWYVERKVSEDRYMIEWELSSAFDVQGQELPARQVVQNTCGWKYRGPECGYTGTNYFDKNDEPTTLANDFCAKRLRSCRNRFGEHAILDFGAYPGARRYE